MNDDLNEFSSGLIIDPEIYTKAGYRGIAYSGLLNISTGEKDYDSIAMIFDDEENGKKVIESIISNFPQGEDKDDNLIISFIEFEEAYDTFIYEDPRKIIKRNIIVDGNIQLPIGWFHQIMHSTGQSISNDYLSFKSQYSSPHQYLLHGISTKENLLSERGLLKYHVHFHMHSELEESMPEYKYLLAKR